MARKRPRPELDPPGWVQTFTEDDWGDDDTSHDPEIITALTRTWTAMTDPGAWWRFSLTALERAEARWRAACERWRADNDIDPAAFLEWRMNQPLGGK